MFLDFLIQNDKAFFDYFYYHGNKWTALLRTLGEHLDSKF